MPSRRDILVLLGMGVGGALVSRKAPFASQTTLHPALYWKKAADKMVQCVLCPNTCFVENGAYAPCLTRQNIDGSFYLLGYGQVCAAHVDPIEKKPFFHVLPGAKAFSVAQAGCNLHCKNCQNFAISQARPSEVDSQYLSPQAVVEAAQKNNCETIAYTYSEPTAWFEYMLDVAKAARKVHIRNLWVTCGYINPEPLKQLLPFIDAATIDVKSFSEIIYRRLNAGKLEPILNVIRQAKAAGVWVEISNLVVPTWSDDTAMIREMCVWIRETIGPDVPLHFLRFWPLYKLAHLYPTPTATLLDAQKVARSEGLHHVYIGNVAEADLSTYCPKCKKAVIKRRGYTVTENNIKDNKCGFCKSDIAGVWK